MSHEEAFESEQSNAIEFMRRFTELVGKTLDGTWDVEDGSLLDIEEKMGMTREEAVAILERRLNPN